MSNNNVSNYFKQPGSGTDNKLVLGGSVETAGEQSLKAGVLTVNLADISTAGQNYVLCPFDGYITTVGVVINGTIATANATLTPKVLGVALTDGAITVDFAGSAAGDAYVSEPTANNRVLAGDAIEIETDGASTNTVSATITFYIELD